MSQKNIKVFDLRQASSSVQTVETKSVYGLSVAPNGNYLCSYVDSLIMLTDLRNIKRPLNKIQANKNHLQLAWCPTRSSLLSSLQRDSPYITLYDIRSVENSRDVDYIRKQLLPFPNKFHGTHKGYGLTAISWHPTDFERALLLSEAGYILDFWRPLCILTASSNHRKLPVVLQRHISSSNSTTPTHSNVSGESNESSLSNNNLKLDILDEELLQHDLVDETFQRAVRDYGLKMDFKRVHSLPLSSYLKNVWQGLANLYQSERLTGLKTILGIGLDPVADNLMSSSRTESHVLQWPAIIKHSFNLVCYRSEQRDKALKLCGWVFEQEMERFIETLKENREYSRAAMICVFHLRILQACDILSKAADHSKDPSMFRIAAIALSSFNADLCCSTWQKQRLNANMQIQDVHLRAIFSFLTTDNDNFDSVLNDDGISLSDRIAFACKYLSESKLSEYVRQQIQKAIEQGDLNGLLLTGESPDGLNILQAYLDSTFDVQTVALVAINYFHREGFEDKKTQCWISSYLDLLSSWGLWEKRAELKIKIEALHVTSRSSRSVFLSCNFCGKSVSTALQEDVRIRSASSNINKLSSCPSCRKPLPRCSLCLLHMGTTINSSSAGEGGHESLGWQSKPFSRWFAWCQTCRHGGHTEHIKRWFEQNSECPVSSCNCHCFDMDATTPNNVRDIP